MASDTRPFRIQPGGSFSSAGLWSRLQFSAQTAGSPSDAAGRQDHGGLRGGAAPTPGSPAPAGSERARRQSHPPLAGVAVSQGSRGGAGGASGGRPRAWSCPPGTSPRGQVPAPEVRGKPANPAGSRSRPGAGAPRSRRGGRCALGAAGETSLVHRSRPGGAGLPGHGNYLPFPKPYVRKASQVKLFTSFCTEEEKKKRYSAILKQ